MPLSITPGPWGYTGYADHCQVGRPYHEIVDADGFEIINQNGLITHEHDARAIAALPELIAAAGPVLDWFATLPIIHDGVSVPRMDALRAALHKAGAL